MSDGLDGLDGLVILSYTAVTPRTSLKSDANNQHQLHEMRRLLDHLILEVNKILEISILETKKRKCLLRLKRIECLASTPILLELSSELCFLLFLAKKNILILRS